MTNLDHIYLLNCYFINYFDSYGDTLKYKTLYSSLDKLMNTAVLIKDKTTLVINYILDNKVSLLNKPLYFLFRKNISKVIIYRCDDHPFKSIKQLDNKYYKSNRDIVIYNLLIKDYIYGFTKSKDNIQYIGLHNSYLLFNYSDTISKNVFGEIYNNILISLEEIHHIKITKQHKQKLLQGTEILESLFMFDII